MPLPAMPPNAGAPKPPPPGAGAPGDSATGPGQGGPIGSPMATPKPMEGIEKAARVQIQVASEMLQRELPHFPLDSPEFDAVSKALATLSKAFGKTKDEDRRLFPAEIMNMLGALGPGAKSPGAAAMGGPPPPGAGGPPGAGAPPPPPMA